MSKPQLNKDFWLGALRAEGDAFRAAVAGATDLSAPVPTCPDWSIAELTSHLANLYNRTRRLITTGSLGRPEDWNTPQPVGPPDTVNNTYVEQIVADAKAAIDKAAEMGVIDPNRVGVGGHSYGAFMTANLLAHCRLFKAGIAESGAYNRTLTPFGFQSERRSFWEAKDTYLNMSPFVFANQIKDPILLIHGEADDNSGTFPIQSDRMYQALRGNGATVRLVFLPDEAHGYRGKETIEHVLWEKSRWFDMYVKNAPATAASGSSGNN